MKVYGQLEYGQVHNLAANPGAAGKKGLVFFNTTDGLFYVDTGAAFRAVWPWPVTTGTRAAPQAIVAANGIAFTGEQPRALWFVTGTGAGITDVSANPQIAAGTIVGQELLLIGRSDSDILLLEDGTGLSLNGPIELGADWQLGMIWDGTNWNERYRSERV